jgi:hypothetical protein
MLEYLIRTASRHEIPPVHLSRLGDVFLPAGFDCEQAEGWDDFRMRCGATQVAVSGEDAG